MLLRTLVLAFMIAGGASAQTPDIHSMVLGDQTWGIADNLQLTHGADGKVIQAVISRDGKHVAFLSVSAGKTRLCLVPSTGGSIVTLASSQKWSAAGVASSVKGAILIYDSAIAWSPDSKLIAFCGARVEGTAKAPKNREVIVVIDTIGAQKACYTLPEGYASGLAAIFSPDSRKLLAPLGGLEDPSVALAVYDLKSNTRRVLKTKAFNGFERWLPTSDAVQYWSLVSQPDGSSGYTLRRIKLSDGSDEAVGQPRKRRAHMSPDGSLSAYVDESGIVVEDSAGKSRTLVSSKSPGLGRWAPDSKMLLYYITAPVSDQSNKRTFDLASLWIANTDAHDFNTMCVTFNLDLAARPAWSGDSTRIAYTSDGRLCVAMLSKRPATPDEKLAAHLPLAEADIKAVTKQNAEQISAAISQFAFEMRRLPNTADELYMYAGKKLFSKPGTDTLIFTYRVKPMTSPESLTANTLLGTLDAGYGWKMDIYPGGRVVVVGKGK